LVKTDENRLFYNLLDWMDVVEFFTKSEQTSTLCPKESGQNRNFSFMARHNDYSAGAAATKGK
jgi:hypothetical protein